MRTNAAGNPGLARRGLCGFSIFFLGLLFGSLLWPMSSPTVQGDEQLIKENQRLQLRVKALETADTPVERENKRLQLRVNALESAQKQSGEADRRVANADQWSTSVSEEANVPVSEESSRETGTAALPAEQPAETHSAVAQGATQSSGPSILHSAVLKKVASLRTLDGFKAECSKALALEADDPYGVPLWRKVLLEHKRSPFGDCRDGKGCHGFVAQGFQDVFLYSALWRHLDRPGVYVDLASNDWKYISNTFLADLCLQWDGICIEANPGYYPGLDLKRRCVVEKSCVAEKAKKVEFNLQGVFGGIMGAMKEDSKKRTGPGHGGKAVSMTCQTLATILKRYGVTHVDYMNLDVEGVELQCLEGTDWDAVTIDVIGIEHNPKFEPLSEFLINKGYVPTVTIAHDVMFVHKTATRVLEILAAWRRDDCPRINAALKSDYYNKPIIPKC